MSITQVVEDVLRFFTTYTGSYAWAIIILTIIIKAAMYPLTVRQFRVIDQMKKIAPKQKELQEKYKGKPEELQRRMAELYRDNKVNPLGGCLPMLLPLPILMIMYRVFLNEAFIQTLKEAGFSIGFLWIPDLSKPDPWILPILSGVTTWVTMQQTATDPAQKSSMIIMPLVLGWITTRLPGGAAIYWVVTNIVTIIQQFFITRQMAVPRKGVS
ncbi:MAG: YidC/Oxa1 family membrane protein insertase [Firmicutes bacterium]|nr:YidC/Oxa1 family membrane protein insertase [Bacillota bacterium]